VDGDPTLTELLIPKGERQTEDSFLEVPRGEHYLTIQNGKRGIRKLEVLVNDQPAVTRWLRDQNVRTIDLAPFMKPGPNAIRVIASGRPGSSALVLIADTPGPDSGAKRFHPLIEWETGSTDPGVNLHWGN
jgi:hypothetical protein